MPAFFFALLRKELALFFRQNQSESTVDLSVDMLGSILDVVTHPTKFKHARVVLQRDTCQFVGGNPLSCS